MEEKKINKFVLPLVSAVSICFLRKNSMSASWCKAFAPGRSMHLKYHRIRYTHCPLATPILHWPPLVSLYIKTVQKVQKYSRGMAYTQGFTDILC